MKLWRVDAIHAGDGALTRYFFERDRAAASELTLSRCGWFVDVYSVELSIDGQTADRLVAGVWPHEADEVLIDLASDAMAKARRALEKARRASLPRNRKK